MEIIGYHIATNLIARHDSTLCTEPPWIKFLLDSKDDTTIMTVYHLDYSIANLLVMIGMDEDSLRKLNTEGEIKYKGYKFRYVPKKFFSISRGSQFALLCDMSQYMDSWHLEPKIDEVDAIKKAHEAKSVGVSVYNALTNLGLTPKSLVSPISVFEKEILRKLDLPKIEDIPEEASEYAYNCTHGPWVETFQKGYFSDCNDMDIKSAYPSQLSELADIRNGNWIKSSKYEGNAYYGYCKGVVDITADFSPIIYSKSEEQTFTPKGEWETYLTKAEIDFIYEYGLGTFEIHDGWFWFPYEIVTPLRGLMNWLYQKKDGAVNMDKKIIKRVMAGIWGRTLQVLQTGEMGDYFNAVWGVEVESRNRLEVARFVLDNDLEDKLLSIAVDGVLVSNNGGC